MNIDRNLVLITGARGFAGRAVSNRLAAAGIEIVGVSRSPARSDCAAPTMIVDDYHDLARSTPALERTATIIHLADQSDRKSYTGYNHTHAADLVTALTSAAAEAGVHRFLFASSIYADQPEKTLYGRSKLGAEAALAKNAGAFQAAVSLRLPPLYGVGASGMVGLLGKQIAKGRLLPLGCANELRRFMGINNFCDLVLAFCRYGGAAGTYSPADPEPVSLKVLAQEISRIGGYRSRLVPVPFIDRLSPATIVSPVFAAREANRIARDLNWSPSFSLSEQLAYLS